MPLEAEAVIQQAIPHKGKAPHCCRALLVNSGGGAADLLIRRDRTAGN
jgi:hypothetical protein